MSHRGSRLPIVLLVVSVLAANLPFVNQAFHIDDAIYLFIAHNVAKSPSFPQDMPTHFEGLYATDLASSEHAVPLTSYWMSIVARLGNGFREIPLHLGFLLFPLVLACSTYSLARRFTAHPLLASLTLLFLPVVYVMSHTLMTDIPQLTLWVASVAAGITGIESRRMPWVWCAAGMAALACFVSYSSLCLIPLLAFWAIRHRNYRATTILLAFPAAAIVAWLFVSYSHYGRLPPAQIVGFYFLVKKVLSPVLVLQKSIYIILTIGGVTIFPVSLLVCSRKRVIAAALVFVYPAMWITGALSYSLAEKTLFLLFFCAGFAAIAESVHALIAGSEVDRFLGLWFFGFLFFCATAYMTGTSRYVLLATPPLVFLFYRRLEQSMQQRRLQQALAATVVLGASLSVLIASADYQFARVYRDFAADLQRIDPSNAHKVWFAGEWGLRAYMEAAGGEELGRRDARPVPGDILVVPTLATPYDTLFDDKLSLDSIVMVVPSKLRFHIPDVAPDSSLEFTMGMPFAEKSDGMDFRIVFESGGKSWPVYSERIQPINGRRWAERHVPLTEVAGKAGDLILLADAGTGDANADWVAIARAVMRASGGSDALSDFQGRFKEAHIEAAPDVDYQTPNNIPIFPMMVWLEQEPATILRGTYNYAPRSPFRLLDATAQAGFWSMHWGMLPFSFKRGQSSLESIRVYEVTRKHAADAKPEPLWYSQ